MELPMGGSEYQRCLVLQGKTHVKGFVKLFPLRLIPWHNHPSDEHFMTHRIPERPPT